MAALCFVGENYEETDIETVAEIEPMQATADRLRCTGSKIAFVPTMGFFHDGHLSLMRAGRGMADFLVVSIFVNPTQFGPGEDYQKYPRDLEKDLALAAGEGVDFVFTPRAESLYGKGFQTYVNLEKLPNHLCGISRPTHFRGVATVVCKLFNIVRPHVAIFGKKDYQQFQIIRRMARDLNFDIDIVGGETVREPDGLAMSSRNSFLTAEQRISARCIYQALSKAQALVSSGTRRSSIIVSDATASIQLHPDTSIDYIRLCDPETLDEVETVDRPVLMAIAAKVGKTRLIDNMILIPSR